MDKAAPDLLAAIRSRIDTIDETMHRLLIDRSTVIAELIDIKGTSRPGAAFRPDREADMMRRIAARHSGGLPLATVEHIWREIITTFTAMQAPFSVLAGPAKDPLAMRDVVRFTFGFSVPVEQAKTSEAAVEGVARSRKSVAVIAANARGRWWDGLKGANAPKIFAKVPFIDYPDRPADLPALIVGPPLKQGFTPDIQILAVPDAPGLKAAVAAAGGALVARAGGEALVELPIAIETRAFAREAGLAARDAKPVGECFQPIRYVSERTA